MESLFSSIGVFLYETCDQRHKTYLIEWKLLRGIVKKWSRNREADMVRVNEMIEYVQHGGYIPPILHIAHIHEEGIVCYDGNHRREVFNRTTGVTSLKVIVDVMFDASQKDVYDAFESLNKCVQLPAIYVEDLDNNMVSRAKSEITEIVKTYVEKYKVDPNYVSSSGRPRAPNFNRDRFTENLYNLWTSFDGKITVAELERAIEVLNQMYATGKICKPHSKYKPSVIEKCRKGGLWLFIDQDIPKQHLEMVLCML